MPVSLDSIVAATRQRISQRISGNRQNSGLRALKVAAAAHTPRGFRIGCAGSRKTAPGRRYCRTEKSFAFKRIDPRRFQAIRTGARSGASRRRRAVGVDRRTIFPGIAGLSAPSLASSSLPCLRKDFIVDEFQIVEARANCADAVLLIVAALDQKELVSLAGTARAQGLDVLCEAHDEQELQRALDAGCDLIGINSRNLRTFEVNLETALRLAEKIPATCVRVAESGIHSGADMARLRSAGYEAFLIGESLMKAERPGEALVEIDGRSKSSCQCASILLTTDN